MEDLTLLREAYPAAELRYQVELGDGSYPGDTGQLDLAWLRRDDVDGALRAVELLPALRYVDLGRETEEENSLTFRDVMRFQELCPQARVAFSFTRFGLELSTLDESLDFRGVKMDDEGEAVREFLPCMRLCKTLDMDNCGVSDEAMAGIRDSYPDMKVIWRVYFGENYGVRTDETRIYASSEHAVPIKTGTAQSLKYCTEVRYLDLGHNRIDDISFVSCMPDLEVAILALNPWSDATPLASCENLEYLEIFSTQLTDLTPLAGLTNLRHLILIFNRNQTVFPARTAPCFVGFLDHISPLCSAEAASPDAVLAENPCLLLIEN